ncbi:MAG TPA: hypothetical protein VFU85_08315 [Nocardioides sp.]|nr:hypothetical protein [Nocardioides sp.]
MTKLGEPADIAAGQVDVARGVVALGRRAPSVHNTQPWAWRVDGDVLELRADRDRQLPVSDPTGRNLMISCGAALHHAMVAAAGLGRAVDVERFPDPGEPDLLAVMRLGETRPVTPSDASLLEALAARVTDRRRFTRWPVPEERLDMLAEVARGRRGARVLPLTAAETRSLTEGLVERAIDVLGRNRRFLAEQKAWIDRADGEGIPAASLPELQPGQRRDRFHRAPVDGSRVVSSDQLLAIATARDDVASWLDTGETLSALWLRATLGGLSVVPLTQVIEVAETRALLREQVFASTAYPQLLARIGWLPVARERQVPTARRRVAEVSEGLPGAG